MEANIFETRSTIDSISYEAESSGVTHVNLTKFQYTWTIKNFSFTSQIIGESIDSPHFVVGNKIKTKWYLKAFPSGKTEDSRDHVSLYLHLGSGHELDVEAMCKMVVLNKDKQEMIVKTFDEVRLFRKQFCAFGFAKFVKHSFLDNTANRCLPNDSLTIVCHLIVAEDTAPRTGQELKVPEPRFFYDMASLFESPKFSDVTLITNSKEFKAHKVILAARSPVFSAIFDQELEDTKLNRIHIEDVPDEVVIELLRFIYTGIAMNLDKMADSLMAAADKYKLDRLKALCEKALCESLAVENVASRLIISDNHEAVYLKAQALDFFQSHADDVMGTESYKSLYQTHPHLIDEAIKTFAKTKIVATTSEDSDLHTPNTRTKRKKRLLS